MISVIISTYNRADKLKRAVKSVLDQSYQDFEVIVVDDNSTDNTSTIMSEFESDARVLYLKRSANFGNDTRPKNEGLMAARGEFVSFLDDDNVYRKDHLAVLWSAIRESSVDGVYGDRWVIDELGEIEPGVGINSDFSQALLLQRNYIDTSDILLRKDSVFAVGGFDEQYKKYIDWNLWVRMAKNGAIFKHVKQVITDYYICSDSKSKRAEDTKENGAPAWDSINCKIQAGCLGLPVSKPKVAIFSLTYDRLEYTKACFESLYKTAGYEFDHYVVDNGSKDGTQSWLMSGGLKAFGGSSSFHLNSDNQGISRASNKALEMIGNGYQIIMKIDNDCFFKTNNWLKKMVEIWEVNRKLALSCYVEGLRDNPGGSQRFEYGTICGEFVGITKHLGGICHFVDASGYENFRWDEGSTLHGVQDLELSHHLAKNGFGMAYLENYMCEHMDGTDGQHAKYPEYFERRKEEKTKTYEENR